MCLLSFLVVITENCSRWSTLRLYAISLLSSNGHRRWFVADKPGSVVDSTITLPRQLQSIVVDKRSTRFRCLLVVENEVNNKLERGEAIVYGSHHAPDWMAITRCEHLLLLISLIIHAKSSSATVSCGRCAGSTLVPCLPRGLDYRMVATRDSSADRFPSYRGCFTG